MKILVQNYSSNLSTESFYFHHALREVGVDCELWTNESVSAFDMFDSYQPNVFVCHFSKMNNDIMKYLAMHKNIAAVINVTGATQEIVDNISETMVHNKINCPFLFTNTPTEVIPIMGRTIKLVNILPALDIFQRKQESVLFRIGHAVVSSQPVELLKPVTDGLDTYHLLTHSNEQGYDLPINIPALISVYDKYEEFILMDSLPVVVSQLFFETSYRAENVRVELNNEDKPKFDKFLQNVFNGAARGSDSQAIAEAVRAQILKKHNAFTRTARLAKFLKVEELENALLKAGESLE